MSIIARIQVITRHLQHYPKRGQFGICINNILPLNANYCNSAKRLNFFPPRSSWFPWIKVGQASCNRIRYRYHTTPPSQSPLKGERKKPIMEQLYAVGAGVVIVGIVGMIIFNVMRSDKGNRRPSKHDVESGLSCSPCCKTEDSENDSKNDSSEPLLLNADSPSEDTVRTKQPQPRPSVHDEVYLENEQAEGKPKKRPTVSHNETRSQPGPSSSSQNTEPMKGHPTQPPNADQSTQHKADMGTEQSNLTKKLPLYPDLSGNDTINVTVHAGGNTIMGQSKETNTNGQSTSNSYPENEKDEALSTQVDQTRVHESSNNHHNEDSNDNSASKDMQPDLNNGKSNSNEELKDKNECSKQVGEKDDISSRTSFMQEDAQNTAEHSGNANEKNYYNEDPGSFQNISRSVNEDDEKRDLDENMTKDPQDVPTDPTLPEQNKSNMETDECKNNHESFEEISDSTEPIHTEATCTPEAISTEATPEPIPTEPTPEPIPTEPTPEPIPTEPTPVSIPTKRIIECYTVVIPQGIPEDELSVKLLKKFFEFSDHNVDVTRSYSTNSPIFVPCVAASRLGSDVEAALSKVGKLGSKITLVILHPKAKHNSNVHPSKDKLDAELIGNVGSVIDVVFWQEEVYDCDQNKKANKELSKLLKKVEPKETSVEPEGKTEKKRTDLKSKNKESSEPIDIQVPSVILSDERQVVDIFQKFLDTTKRTFVVNASSTNSSAQLVLPCIAASRLGSDVEAALSKVKHTGSNITLVILHPKAKHNSNVHPSKDKLDADLISKVDSVIDVVFWQEEVYQCDQNKKAKKTFLKVFETGPPSKKMRPDGSSGASSFSSTWPLPNK